MSFLQIDKLHESLEVANECIALAQNAVIQTAKYAGPNKAAVGRIAKEFNDHLKVFARVLIECDNFDCKCINLSADKSFRNLQ